MGETELTELSKRVKCMDEIITSGAENIQYKSLSSILPPARKSLQVIVYDLQQSKAEFYVSMVCPYRAKGLLQGIDASNGGLEKKFKELGMASLDVKTNNRDEIAFELQGTLDLETPNEINAKDSGLCMSDISAGGSIKKIVQGIYADDTKHTKQTLWVLDEKKNDGVLFEFDLSEDPSLMVDSETRPAIYKIKEGQRIARTYKNQTSFLSAQEDALKFAKRNQSIKSISTYMNGKQIQFLDFLKDMRKWYNVQADPAYS